MINYWNDTYSRLSVCNAVHYGAQGRHQK